MKIDKRKLLGFIIGILLFSAFVTSLSFAYYKWQSDNTDVGFVISDSYFYCESEIEMVTNSLAPVLDYRNGSVQKFKVNNIGKQDTTFSVSLNITKIDSPLKSASFKYKLVVDTTGGSNNCVTSSSCSEVENGSGDFSNVKVGMNTLVSSVSLPNNSRYEYYLFMYIDGSVENDVAMQGSEMTSTLGVCEVVAYLDANGGSVSPDFIKLVAGTEKYPTIPTPTRSNSVVTYNYNSATGGNSTASDTVSYTFNGWYKDTDTSYTNKIVEGSNLTDTTNHTLKARWTASKSVTLPTPTRTGYTFGGWYSDSSFNNKVGNAGATYNPSKSITLYAKWTANIYKITLDNQSATNAGTTTVYYQYNTTKTIDGITCYYYTDSSLNTCISNGYIITKPTKTGYTFGGYYTATAGSGTQYVNENGSFVNNIYKTAGDRTLYAKWTANIYKITLDNQSATNAGTTTVYYQYNTTKTIDGITCYYYTDSSLNTCISNGYIITKPTKTGYTFGGYYTATAGSGTQYVNENGSFVNNIYKTAGDRTLYAKWTINNYIVTYDYSTNGGTSATKTTASVAYGSSVDLTPTATKDGWTFVGWNTNKDATSKLNSLTMGTSNVTLYAIYKKTGQVTFNLNGNASFTYSGTKYTSTKSFDLCTMYNTATTCTASVTMPTIAAHSNTPTVIGWSNAADNHTPTYKSGQTGVTLTSGTTWYAQTKKDSVQGKVTFNPNGNASFTYSGTKYTSTTSFNLCTIAETYNGTAQATTCTASVTMPTIAAHSNTPTVIGWSDAASKHNATYGPGQASVTLTSGTTWYAQTKKASVQGKVTFNPNGNASFTYSGTKYTSTTSFNLCTIAETYNGTAQASTCTASITMPTIEASSNTPTVIGWSNAASKHNATYGPGQASVTLTSGTTWYAQTKKASVQGKVTFNPNGNASFTYSGTKYTSTTTVNLCTIGETYNGTAQASTCTASVTMPTIEASTNTPTVIGWSDVASKHNATYGPGQASVTLTSGTTWYAQTKKASAQGKVTFNPNGNASFTYSGTKYTATTTVNLCTIGETYNGTAQATTCTASVTMPTIEASSNTPTIIGWSNASDNHTPTYTSGQTGATLTSGTTWYAQTKKDEVTLNASFNANGATLSSTTAQSCTLAITYNGTAQNTSCTVTAPTITRSGYTIVGFNTSASSTSNNSSYSSSTGKITLTGSNTGATWYAITYKKLTATFYYYNSGIKNTSATCNMYNTSTSCSATVPTSTFSSTTAQYGGSYVGYGAVNTMGTTTSSTVSISQDTSYYVSYRKNVTEYYKNTSRTIYRNAYFTSTSAMSTVLSTSNTGTSNLSGESYTASSITWSWYGYATSSSTSSRSYSTVANAATSTTTALYTLYSRSVTATFYYYNGSAQATTTASGTQLANYQASVVSNGSISIPSAVTSSTGPNNVSYTGLSTTAGSTTTTTTINTSQTKYYAIYIANYTASFTKENSNVSSIGSTSLSCSSKATTNGTTYSSTACSITLPTITPATGYIALGWYNSSGTLVGQAGSSINITSNQSYTAKAKRPTASDFSYDNSETGVDCTDVQCMIDKLAQFTAVQEVINLYNDGSSINTVYIGGSSSNPQVKLNATQGIMLDNNGDYRYYGANPNNYVTFNGETWRIIGAFNNVDDGTGKKETRLKIIRNVALFNNLSMIFDHSDSTINSGYGVNDWSKADLNIELNDLYYNSTSGYCYFPTSSGGSISGECDFTSEGLGSDARSMIDNAVYHLGGISQPGGLYADDYYNFERGKTVYSCSTDDGACPRATTWTGKVGLMYPSDYTYATDLSVCTSAGSDYNNTTCKSNDWLFLQNKYLWTITPKSSSAYYMWLIYGDGYIYQKQATPNDRAFYLVRPAVYLKSNVAISGGSGTSSDPYTLELT